jgi:hypothetical protein
MFVSYSFNNYNNPVTCGGGGCSLYLPQRQANRDEELAQSYYWVMKGVQGNPNVNAVRDIMYHLQQQINAQLQAAADKMVK